MRHRVLRGDDLPHRLADLSPPPASLHLWGELPPAPYVAIVGSRRATRRAQAFARQLAAELSRAGVTIISGGAEGIDRAAHAGALDAGAPTLVVAPCGFDKPYPAGNRPLFRRIVARGGGYLSLEPAEAGATRAGFFRRNAVLAALCDALVLGEANLRSGGRNAVKWARSLGRAVFSTPSAAWNLRGRGSNLELRAGARWLEEPGDLLRYLEESGQLLARRTGARHEGTSRDAAEPSAPGGAGWSGAPARDLDAVGRAIRAGCSHVDSLCEATGLQPAEVNVAVLELTVRGAVGSDTNGLLCWRGSSSKGGGIDPVGGRPVGGGRPGAGS